MITRHSRKNVSWIDLEAPTPEELRAVMEEFDIDNRVEEEIISPTPYPLVLSSTNYLYLILHFPTSNPNGGAHSQEIDFIVGKKFVITVRYEVIESIHSLHRIFETEELLNLPSHFSGADHVIERVLRHVYGAIRDQAEQAATRMEAIEDGIFAGRERAMVRDISLVARVLLRFDTTLTRHEEPLKAFLEDLTKPAFFGASSVPHAAHIQAEHDHTSALVSSYRAVIRELRITNDSLLSSAQNEIMKTFTIMAFLTYPLTIIVGVFGMNTEHTPLVSNPWGFWAIIALMLVAAFALFIFFRLKRWL